MKISFAGLLALIFITLKLTGHIAWSWWLVLAPLWIPVALYLMIIFMPIIALSVALVTVGALTWWDEKHS